MMSSERLNHNITRLCNLEDPPYDCADSGKPVPYIGWFWRTVNFDVPTLSFGVVPRGGENQSRRPFVGFMVANKWGYESVRADEDQTIAIRAALESACLARTRDRQAHWLRVADELIQSLAKLGLPEARMRR